MSKFLEIREKIRAKIPEGVRQKLLAMHEDDISATAMGEPVHAINVNEKSVTIPTNNVETIDIDSARDIPTTLESNSDPIRLSKDDDIEYTITSNVKDDIEYDMASNTSSVHKTEIIDADYQIPYGKEPFLGKEQIVDIIKMVTLGSVAINIIFAILHVGVISCVLLVIITMLIHAFCVQEYNHPTYI